MADDRIDDLEERYMILRDKAAREGIGVDDEVLEFIAEKYALPQTLKGALINVSAYAQRRGIPVTMDVARLVLDGVRPKIDTPDATGPEPTPEGDTPDATGPEPTPEGGAPGVSVGVAGGDALRGPSSVGPEPVAPVQPAAAFAPEPVTPVQPSLEDTLAAVLDATVTATGADAAPSQATGEDSLFVAEAEPVPPVVDAESLFAGPHTIAPEASAPPQPMHPSPEPAYGSQFAPSTTPEPATVWFAPMRTTKKESLVKRAGRLLTRAGLADAVADGDLVAIKVHFGEEGNTGFVSPVFLREVVRLVREAGGKPFLTDANTLYQGQRANAVDHLACAIHNGFGYATVDAPLVIADGLNGRDAEDVAIEGYDHFDSVRIGSAAVNADAMVVVTHVKGHEATGMGGAFKNVGMGLGCRSAKQRMHSDLKPQITADKCIACARCVKWCPVHAIAITPDRVARIDYELCYGCGECVAACPHGAIAIQWKTEPAALQEKIVEHTAGALDGKDGKVVYLSFLTDISPDCDCWNFSDASVVPDIGVLASTDIVAIDQAALDLVTKARGSAGSRGEGMAEGAEKFQPITGIDPTLGLEYAERHGLGTRKYELRTME